MYQDGAGHEWVRTTPQIHQRARELRKQMTLAECTLWAELRKAAVDNFAFRRRHPYGPYIFDFYCPQMKLVIELDGPVHDDPIHVENDEERDARSEAHGLTVLRFANDIALNDPAVIVAAIRRHLENQTAQG